MNVAADVEREDCPDGYVDCEYNEYNEGVKLSLSHAAVLAGPDFI